MKILMTGSDGWLGRRLTSQLLADGHDLVALVEPTRHGMADPRLTAISADLRHPIAFHDAFHGCEAVISVAGCQHPRRTRDLYDVNGRAPARLLTLALRLRARTFVHISSQAALGPSQQPFPLPTEDRPARPRTHYGRSKLAGEQRLLDLAEGQPIKLTILRPAVFVGTDPSVNMREFVGMIKNRRLPLFGRDGFHRSYVDIDHVVHAVIAATRPETPGGLYFVADSPPLTTAALYHTLGDAIGSVPKILRLPAFVARLAEALSLALGRIGLHTRLFNIMGEFGRHYTCDGEKARHAFNIPVESLSMALEEMAHSALSYPSLRQEPATGQLDHPIQNPGTKSA